MSDVATWYCVPPCGLLGELVEWRFETPELGLIVAAQYPRLLLRGEVLRVNVPAQAVSCIAIVETERGQLPIEFKPMCEATVPVQALKEAKS